MTGGNRLDDVLLHAAALKVCELAPCPVAVVRCRHGLVPADGGPVVLGLEDLVAGALAVTAAFADAQRHASHLVVLHAGGATRSSHPRYHPGGATFEHALLEGLGPWRSRHPSVPVDAEADVRRGGHLSAGGLGEGAPCGARHSRPQDPRTAGRRLDEPHGPARLVLPRSPGPARRRSGRVGGAAGHSPHPVPSRGAVIDPTTTRPLRTPRGAAAPRRITAGDLPFAVARRRFVRFGRLAFLFVSFLFCPVRGSFWSLPRPVRRRRPFLFWFFPVRPPFPGPGGGGGPFLCRPVARPGPPVWPSPVGSARFFSLPARPPVPFFPVRASVRFWRLPSCGRRGARGRRLPGRRARRRRRGAAAAAAAAGAVGGAAAGLSRRGGGGGGRRAAGAGGRGGGRAAGRRAARRPGGRARRRRRWRWRPGGPRRGGRGRRGGRLGEVGSALGGRARGGPRFRPGARAVETEGRRAAGAAAARPGRAGRARLSLTLGRRRLGRAVASSPLGWGGLSLFFVFCVCVCLCVCVWFFSLGGRRRRVGRRRGCVCVCRARAGGRPSGSGGGRAAGLGGGGAAGRRGGVRRPRPRACRPALWFWPWIFSLPPAPPRRRPGGGGGGGGGGAAAGRAGGRGGRAAAAGGGRAARARARLGRALVGRSSLAPGPGRALRRRLRPAPVSPPRRAVWRGWRPLRLAASAGGASAFPSRRRRRLPAAFLVFFFFFVFAACVGPPLRFVGLAAYGSRRRALRLSPWALGGVAAGGWRGCCLFASRSRGGGLLGGRAGSRRPPCARALFWCRLCLYGSSSASPSPCRGAFFTVFFGLLGLLAVVCRRRRLLFQPWWPSRCCVGRGFCGSRVVARPSPPRARAAAGLAGPAVLVAPAGAPSPGVGSSASPSLSFSFGFAFPPVSAAAAPPGSSGFPGGGGAAAAPAAAAACRSASATRCSATSTSPRARAGSSAPRTRSSRRPSPPPPPP